MTSIVTIVEGHGEVKALGILLRRFAESKGIYDLSVPEPIRVSRDRFLNRNEEFRSKILLAKEKAKAAAPCDGHVLILLDADDDCPKDRASELKGRAAALFENVSFQIVFANREYESWLIAGAESFAGQRGFSTTLDLPADPDAIRDAKGWLSERMEGSSRYHEVIDQPALTAIFNLETAFRRSRSFKKFSDAVGAMLGSRSSSQA